MTWRRDNDPRGTAASREQMQEPPQLIKGEREFNGFYIAL